MGNVSLRLKSGERSPTFLASTYSLSSYVFTLIYICRRIWLFFPAGEDILYCELLDLELCLVAAEIRPLVVAERSSYWDLSSLWSEGLRRVDGCWCGLITGTWVYSYKSLLIDLFLSFMLSSWEPWMFLSYESFRMLSWIFLNSAESFIDGLNEV